MKLNAKAKHTLETMAKAMFQKAADALVDDKGVPMSLPGASVTLEVKVHALRLTSVSGMDSPQAKEGPKLMHEINCQWVAADEDDTEVVMTGQTGEMDPGGQWTTTVSDGPTTEDQS